MPDYRKMYLKMAQETEKAIRILIAAQKECEELYIEGDVSSQVKRAKFGQEVYQCRVEVSPGSIPAEKVSL